MSGSNSAAEKQARRPGRPRSSQARQAILRAALELLVHDGFDGMTIERVAERAGVGKATIYRRWDSKQALVAAALASINDESRVPNTGNLRDDLLAMIDDLRTGPATAFLIPMLSRVIGAAVTNPQFMEIVKENHIDKRRRIVLQIFERARDRGELRPDVDLSAATDLLAGAILFGLVFRDIDAATLHNHAERVIATLWSGIAAGETPD